MSLKYLALTIEARGNWQFCSYRETFIGIFGQVQAIAIDQLSEEWV
jgi:hypothetical protein